MTLPRFVKTDFRILKAGAVEKSITLNLNTLKKVNVPQITSGGTNDIVPNAVIEVKPEVAQVDAEVAQVVEQLVEEVVTERVPDVSRAALEADEGGTREAEESQVVQEAAAVRKLDTAIEKADPGFKDILVEIKEQKLVSADDIDRAAPEYKSIVRRYIIDTLKKANTNYVSKEVRRSILKLANDTLKASSKEDATRLSNVYRKIEIAIINREFINPEIFL